MIRCDTIEFFRHSAVEAAQTRLNVGHANLKLGRRQRSGYGGVGIAIHDDRVWFSLLQDRLDPFKHSRGLGTVRSGSHREIEVRLWKRQLLEEDFRHLRVLVLPGVEKLMSDTLAGLASTIVAANGRHNHCSLNKLRTSPNDGKKLHRY